METLKYCDNFRSISNDNSREGRIYGQAIEAYTEFLSVVQPGDPEYPAGFQWMHYQCFARPEIYGTGVHQVVRIDL